jgi:serine/threonine-protein kinase
MGAEHEADRNLVAGILALRLELITEKQLVAALRAWSAKKSRPFDDVLIAAGDLDSARAHSLAAQLKERLQSCGDDPALCLAALSVSASLREDLLRIADPELTAGLTLVPPQSTEPDPYATQPGPSSDGLSTDGASDALGTQVLAEMAGAAARTVAGSGSTDRYRILRLYARGGLGLVSIAEDGELHRQVALKEIQEQHAANAVSRARFMAEAEITGRLEHPGIVPVYGFGRYADGRPYYAMRLIRGQSLRNAIEAYFNPGPAGQNEVTRALEFRGLLGRFIAVCNTIEYAHSRGFLHRDLKPDNIMLGDYGETLVVDWGLAKAVDDREVLASAGDAPLVRVSIESCNTVPGAAIGTPQFMSPEQAAGDIDALGPATDIYGLGATLYQLLTGSMLFERAPLQDLLKDVRTGNFRPPRARKPSLPKALEAICLKALALQPENRYRSAAGLADDLEHWLADEPVSVYRESWSQRMGRWSRRHRAATQATVAALAAIAIVAVVAVFIIQGARNRESAAKVEATRRAQQAREVIDALLTSVGQVLENYPGMQEARKRLLERAANDYVSLTDASSSDPDLRLEAARAFSRLGDVRVSLNQYDEAEAAYRSAEAAARELCERFPSRRDFQIERANDLTRRAIAVATRGRIVDAERDYRASLHILEPLTQAHPDEVEAADALGSLLVNLARSQSETGRLDEAEATSQQAIRVLEKFARAPWAQPRQQFALAAARNSLGQLLVSRGRETAALPVYHEADEDFGRLVAAHPGEAAYLSARAANRVNLAAALRGAGRIEDEIESYRPAVEDYATLLAALPDVPRYREYLAITRTNLSQGLHRLGENQAAMEELQKALDELDGLASEFPSIPSYLEELAATRTTLASVLRDLARFENATTRIDEAISYYRQLVDALPGVPRYRAGLGVALSHRARILMQLDNLPEAEQVFQAAVAELQQAIAAGPADPHFRENLAATWRHCAWLRHRSGDSPGCRAAQQHSLVLLDELTREFPDMPRFADERAWMLTMGPFAELQDLPQAAVLAGRATNLAPANDAFWRTLGAVQYAMNDFSTARATLQRACDLGREKAGTTVFLLAMAEWRLGNRESARSLHERATAWFKLNRPGDDECQRVHDRTAAVLAEPAGPLQSP